MINSKKMPAIDDLRYPLFWPESDTGTYGFYNNNKDHNSGPVGDWMSSHRYIIDAIPQNKRRTCVQAGGAMGLYPVLLASRFDLVVTFEPYWPSFNYLKANCANEMKWNVEAHNKALGEIRRSNVNMIVPSQQNLGMNRVDTSYTGNGSVDMIELDSLCLKEVDLIWFDLEGHEYKALLGSMQTIKATKPIIGIERPSNDVYEFLKKLGYERENAKKSAMDVFFYPS
ncbi:MAG: hypothetical protein COA52_00880 [Hyphomicrobiales bacterium]|nr:MAG: hypothetical protein COA52_00880 [Hyphomicrobiales bacterium]